METANFSFNNSQDGQGLNHSETFEQKNQLSNEPKQIFVNCTRSATFNVNRVEISEPLNEKSVALVKRNGDYVRTTIIGESAESINKKNQARKYGVSINNKTYFELVAGALVMALGENDHHINCNIVAPDDAALKLRQSFDETKRTFQEALTDIAYVNDDVLNALNNSKIKLSNIVIDNLNIITESEAVMQIAPPKLRSCLLLQIGHGDTQLSAISNGKLKKGSTVRSKGMLHPINELYNAQYASTKEVSYKDFVHGWTHDNKLPEYRNLDAVDDIDFSSDKKDVLDSFVYDVMSQLISDIESKNIDIDEFQGILLSGGGANDKILVEAISEYFQDRNIKVFTIQQLTKAHTPTTIPNQYSAALGALLELNKLYPKTESENIGIDVGNGFSKIAYFK